MPSSRPRFLDTPVSRLVLRYASRANTWIYRRTDGRLGGKGPGRAPVCLLTTTGRTSGRPRTVPLLYLADDANVVVVASQGGLPENPQWYRNLVADPAVTVRTGGVTRSMRARTADDAERAALWPRLTALYKGYDSYQGWTAERTIPVVICEPA